MAQWTRYIGTERDASDGGICGSTKEVKRVSNHLIGVASAPADGDCFTNIEIDGVVIWNVEVKPESPWVEVLGKTLQD